MAFFSKFFSKEKKETLDKGLGKTKTGFFEKVKRAAMGRSQVDEDFLDEARTQPFIESGKWTNADRQAMAERAKAIMRQRCLTPENMERAQRNADRQLREFLKKINVER